MKRLLNTLFIMTPGTYLAKDGECILVKVEGKKSRKIPIGALEGVICFGQVSYSPFLLGHCAKNGVVLTHLTEYGRYLARMEGERRGNVFVRHTQSLMADNPEQSGKLAHWFVFGKIYNSRVVLLRGAREVSEAKKREQLRRGAERLGEMLNTLAKTTVLNEIRGVEGQAARIYWELFPCLLAPPKSDLMFNGRSRRPPLDQVNAMLSFLYTVLAHDIRSALEAAGLDPYIGFLHVLRPGRPGLALDMMEEFRAVLVDRVVISMINRGQVNASGFAIQESGAVVMSETTRKDLLAAWQKRKKEEKIHPYLEEKSPIGLFPHTQALLLNRFFRNDLDGYPSCLWQ